MGRHESRRDLHVAAEISLVPRLAGSAARATLSRSMKADCDWIAGLSRKPMAMHGEIAQALRMPVFFCEKSSPWQRPSNENTVSIKVARS